MQPLHIWFVKPHPPRRVLDGRQPLPEEPRHGWEPITLKLFAYRLRAAFGEAVESTIWHLLDEADDHAFVQACGTERPDVVAFSEIDLVVNEVRRLTRLLRRVHPRCLIVVGGKHTSLLAPGDRSPFDRVDLAIAGDGVEPLSALCAALLDGRRPDHLPGMVRIEGGGLVTKVERQGRRDDLADIDGVALHAIPVRNHTLVRYLAREQRFPAPLPAPYRVATVLTGIGCPHACVFCQSPCEYGDDSRRVVHRDPESVADEVVWLVREHAAQAVFAQQPSLELPYVLRVYRALEARGVTSLPISGFVRAADIVRAERDGLLKMLVACGLRVVSVGLDIPYTTREDRFGKAFDFATMEESLDLCERRGIAVAATVVAAPDMTARELAESLEPLCDCPLVSVDVRLAMALRNTAYFRETRRYLLRHPDRDPAFFDHQSYRYQTIRIPGKVRPAETYRIVRGFLERFATEPRHRDAVQRLVAEHPGLAPVFVDGGGGGRRPAAPAYDPLAGLYDEVFRDISVRRAEWRWVDARLQASGDVGVLDVGCGTGALLATLSARIGSGVGMDVSERMLERARERCAGDQKLTFARTGGDMFPFADASFDIVVSFLSLHYLEWELALTEIMRVLRPGGRFLCVDMAASPLALREAARFAVSRAGVLAQHLRRPGYARCLKELVHDPDWQAMERRYPLRPVGEYEDLADRLGARLETLSVGARAKVVAFEHRKAAS